MSVVPANNYAVFWGVDTTFTYSGTTYRAISDIEFQYGHKIHEEATTGTAFPYIGTGVYHGEISFTSLGSSDNFIYSGVIAVSGIVRATSATWGTQDTQGGMSGQVWTVSGKITQFSQKASKDGVVEYKLKMILGSPPVIAPIMSGTPP
jgi:hypothetical protein